MCRRIALALIILVVLGAAGVAWLATRPVGVTPSAAIAPAHPASPEDVRAAEDRLRSALKPAPAPAAVPTQPSAFAKPDPARPDSPPPLPAKPGDLTVRLSQDDLNTLLANDPHIRAKLVKAGVSSIQIALAAPDEVAAAAQVDYQGHVADVKADGTLSVTPDGAFAFTPRSMAVGLLPLPQSVSDNFKDRVDAALQQLQTTLPLRVEQVRVEDRQIVLTGPAKNI